MPPRLVQLPSFSVIVLGGALLAACGGGGPPKPPPPEVGVVTLTAQSVTLTSVLPGRTESYRVSDVRPQVNGIVLKRLFTEGGIVTAGQSLYQIDPAPYIAAFNNAKAALASAQVKAARYGQLWRQHAIAHQDYDDAQAAYLQAKANAEAAAINLGYTRVVAPISGRIGRSAVTEGALVTANQATALATIQTLDPIYVDINQSSAELLNLKLAVQGGRLTRDAPVEARTTLTLDNGTAYPTPGRLQFSEVTVDATTGAVTLRAVFPNSDGILLPGMFVRATVIEGTRPGAILAPQQAIGRTEKGDPTAYVVDANGIARLHVIRVGQAVGDKWLVLEGLKAGDRLIVEGLQKVQADQPVHAVPAGSRPSAPPAGQH
ncbi:MAG: efflux RND transporter periplasmic adaptor subunit [Alphaproteobacteria bacterium]|nr:efflux RND transporter periplasmic adaptor subunit [Alphaproteobacteria bacterium]MBL7098920.1 efflux RND transporter periplasmic adaptor subunit [Alphaproteobacteria bacterium]